MTSQDTKRKGTQVALYFSMVAIFISLLLSGLVLINRFNETNTKRTLAAQRDQAIRNSIRTILCLARTQIVQDKTVGPVQREHALHFYTVALKSIQALPCGPLVLPRR